MYYRSGKPVIFQNHPPTEMLEIVQQHKRDNLTIAEIGVAEGHTSKLVIDVVVEMKGHMYAVDWFQGNLEVEDPEHPHGHNTNQEVIDFKYNHYYNLMRSKFSSTEEMNKHLTILKGKSFDVADFIQDESLDICFLDAGHGYEDVSRDIKRYLPKIKPGGIICGHDYDFMHDDVVKAVDEMFHDRVIVVHAGRTPCRSWKVML